MKGSQKYPHVNPQMFNVALFMAHSLFYSKVTDVIPGLTLTAVTHCQLGKMQP